MKEYFKRFERALKEMPIHEGDILYVTSDISLLMHYAYKNLDIKTMEQRTTFLNNLVNVFQNTVGEKGTLLFPVFTWKFCKGKEFDYRKTKGETGIFANWILENRNDFARTKHPLYSFMVWGKDIEYLKALDNLDSFGSDSPFAYLHNHCAKLLLLNVSLQRGFTFMHYVEESLRVPYRYMKEFCGKYIDEYGKEETGKYSMYVRDLAIESEENLPEEFLTDPKINFITTIDDVKLRMIKLAEAYNIVEQDLLYNKGQNCYKFLNYEIDWTKGATHEDEISYRLFR